MNEEFMKSILLMSLVVSAMSLSAHASEFDCKSISKNLTYKANTKYGEITILRGNREIWTGDGYEVKMRFLERMPPITRYTFVHHEDNAVDMTIDVVSERDISGSFSFQGDSKLNAKDLVCTQAR